MSNDTYESTHHHVHLVLFLSRDDNGVRIPDPVASEPSMVWRYGSEEEKRKIGVRTTDRHVEVDWRYV